MSFSFIPDRPELEASRMVSLIEHQYSNMPFALEEITTHRYLHDELFFARLSSEQAIAAWRAALARRWQHEIQARRLYKQVVRQCIDQLPEPRPPLQLIGHSDSQDKRPVDLLDDLRKLHAALTMLASELPFAAERLHQIEAAASNLARTIEEAQRSEERRHEAILAQRLLQDAFLRARNATERRISEFLDHSIERVS